MKSLRQFVGVLLLVAPFSLSLYAQNGVGGEGGGTGGLPSLNVRRYATDPSPCNASWIWYNTTSQLYKICPGGTAQTITNSGGGSSLFSALIPGTFTGGALNIGTGGSFSTTGTGVIGGNVAPVLFGSTTNNNPICMVGGAGSGGTVTYSTLAGCATYFSGNTMEGGIIWHMLGAEDISTNPFRPPINNGSQLEVKLFKGIHNAGTGGLHPCGTSTVDCFVWEVPAVIPAGAQITGSGPITLGVDPAGGTEWTYGTGFPASVGAPSTVTPTTASTGGSLSNGTYYFVVSEAVNAQTNSSYSQSNGTPVPGLHSNEFSIAISGGTSTQTITVPFPAIPTYAGSQPFIATEYYVYMASQFTGTVTVSNTATGGCPGAISNVIGSCVTVATGSNFNQGEDVSLLPGTPIVINGTTYHIYRLYNSTVLSTMEQVSSGGAWTSSLATWSQVITNANGNSCSASGNGTMDPTDCLLTSSTVVASTTGLGEWPLPVDVSNCLVYLGDRNATQTEFNTVLQNLSINLENYVSTSTPTPANNAPSCAIYDNSAQEGTVIDRVPISGGSQQAYFVFSNDGPNGGALTNSIYGGGPNGWSGTVTTTNSAIGGCSANCATWASGNYFGNWWGSDININGSVYQVSGISNGGQTLQLTTAPGTNVTAVPYCMGTNMASTNCSAPPTRNSPNYYGNFIGLVYDGSNNPGATANGTARLIQNESFAFEGGAGLFAEMLIRGNRAAPVISGSHFESYSSSAPGVLLTAGANATVIGDKHAAYYALLQDSATGGSFTVLNAAPGSGANLTQDDSITAGMGNCNGNNSMCNSPGATTAGTTLKNPVLENPTVLGALNTSYVQNYAADTGTANTYAINVVGAPATTSVGTGYCARFLPANNASGASTLNLTPAGGTAWGAIALDKAITGGVTALVSSSDLNTTKIYTACYNGTVFVLQDPSSVPNIAGTLTSTEFLFGNGNSQIGGTTNAEFDATHSFAAKWNSETLAGLGWAYVRGVTSQKAETGSADTNVLTVTPASATGTYRACFVASVASATSGVIGWTLTYTDSEGNAQSSVAQSLFQNGTAAPALTFTTSAAGNYHHCAEIDVNSAGSNIVVKWVGGGTTAAKVSATIERLGQ
jgi:hypothetical protein